METSSILIFYVNGKKISIENPNPEWTLLYYLRYTLGLCGTKEGCSEGGCGACTVLLSKFDDIKNKIINLAINACLMPLCSLHGCAIVTVEGIGSVRTKVHPIQERIAKSHGTQCGFCTPGFVMSMYALLRNNPNPEEKDIQNAFQGNLCRCTGYRPILSGFKTFCCKTGVSNESCCLKGGKNGELQLANTLFDPTEFIPYDPDTQDVLFPPELQVNAKLYKESLVFRNASVDFYRPNSLKKLLDLKSKFPKAKILAGNTELGLEAKFKNQIHPIYIQVSQIYELVNINVEKSGNIVIGGGTTLSDLQNFCSDRNNARTGDIFQALSEMIHWFAGPQIRNVATVAGNIINASPIADLNPIFIAAKAEALLQSKDGTRIVKLDEKFFKSYRTTDIHESEVLVSLIIPPTKQTEFIWATKQCRRREDDIAIVNTAMSVEFKSTDSAIVQHVTIAFGGMAPVTKTASSAAEFLIGKKWSHELLEPVIALLVQDFPLSVDVPGAMPAYRQSLCASFFYKFYLHVSNWLSYNLNIEVPIPHQSVMSAIRPCIEHNTKDSQLYQIVPSTQPKCDLVGRPTIHLSAIKHATGEAVYIDDIPITAKEIFGAFVINRKIAFGKIINIDASAALAMDGVVDFLTSKNLPVGTHLKFGEYDKNEYVFAEDEVRAIGQIIGLILANDQITAEKAAKLVTVEIETKERPIITIEEAIEKESFLCHRRIKNGECNFETEHIIEGELRVGGQEHFYLETQSVLAVPKEDEEMEIFLGTQGVVNMQRHIASCLGVSQNRITVKTRRVGGSFGGKESRSALLGISAAVAAHKNRVPVRIVLNRYDDMEITGHRPSYLFRYKVGFTSEGDIHSVKMEIYLNAGHASDLSEAILEITIFSIDGAFRIPNWEIDGWACKTNTQPNTAMRGFGAPEGSVVMHTIFERVAIKLGMDSLEIRKKHIYREGDLTPSNQLLINCTAQRCLEECIHNSDYETRKRLTEEFNKLNKWKKRGIAITFSKHNLGFNSKFLNQAGALVMIHLDGSVTLNHGGMEMGQGLHTKMVQIATRVFQIPAIKIYFSETASDKVPNANATCGSVSSDLYGGAVLNACEILVERLAKYKAANPTGQWDDWVSAAFHDQTNLSAVGFYKYTNNAVYSFETNSGNHSSYTAYGAACTEVEIDCLTGDHTVLRTDIVMDVGESLNPAVDIGQIEGAFIQGYGLFVMEELLHSPKGHLLTRGPSMYKIPTMNDIPREFNVSILRGSLNPRAVYSSKGIGEPPLTLSNSVFFAIRSAIMDARKEFGISEDFQFDSPATAEKIRLACQNEFSILVNHQNVDEKLCPWGIAI